MVLNLTVEGLTRTKKLPFEQEDTSRWPWALSYRMKHWLFSGSVNQTAYPVDFKLVSFHSCMNQFLIVRFSMYTHTHTNTVKHHLMKVSSEKCTTDQFCSYEDIIDCACTNLDSIDQSLDIVS